MYNVSPLDYEVFEYWEYATVISLSPVPGMWDTYTLADELVGWLAD